MVDKRFIEQGYEHALKTYKEHIKDPDSDHYEPCMADETLVVLEMYARGVSASDLRILPE